MTTFFKLSTVASVLLAYCAVAHAQESAAWKMSELQNSDGEPWGAALIAKSATGKEIGFRCIEGKLLAAFAMEPSDMKRAFEKAGPQRIVKIEIAIDTGAAQEDNWLLLRRHDVIASADQSISRRLYNAAVNGETIRIDSKKYGAAKYDMPEPDAEAFASFMATCGFAAKAEET